MNDQRPTPRLATDAAIVAMFHRRAQRGDGGGLRDSILGATAAMPQDRPWRSRIRGLVPSRAQRLVVVALLLLAVAALAVIGSGGLRREQAPKATAEWFIHPFEYTIPPVSALRASTGGPHRDVIAWVEGPDLVPDPSMVPLYGGQLPESGNHRGILLALGEPAWSHSSDGRFDLRPAPAEFLADLRDTADLTLGPIVETSLDGRAALTARVAEGEHTDIHVGRNADAGLVLGPFVLVDGPAQITVTEIDGRTIFVIVWARTSADLDAWMPIVDEFMSSIHFVPEGGS